MSVFPSLSRAKRDAGSRHRFAQFTMFQESLFRRKITVKEIVLPDLRFAHAGTPTPCQIGLRLPIDQPPVHDGPIYGNVWPQSTLLDVGGGIIAVSIGYDWFPDFDLSRRHYFGPGDTWWGTDVAIVPEGGGRCVLSQLRIVENLGRDPVADRILYNLIEFAASPR